MKIFITTCITMLMLSAFGQTTEEEYNYVTKGYKIQIESGLDMKKGYYFKDIKISEPNKSGIQKYPQFKHLYREGEAFPCATLMILSKSKYLCIPHLKSNHIVMDRYYFDFHIATYGWTEPSKDVIRAMANLISHLSSE